MGNIIAGVDLSFDNYLANIAVYTKNNIQANGLTNFKYGSLLAGGYYFSINGTDVNVKYNLSPFNSSSTSNLTNGHYYIYSGDFNPDKYPIYDVTTGTWTETKNEDENTNMTSNDKANVELFARIINKSKEYNFGFTEQIEITMFMKKMEKNSLIGGSLVEGRSYNMSEIKERVQKHMNGMYSNSNNFDELDIMIKEELEK